MQNERCGALIAMKLALIKYMIAIITCVFSEMSSVDMRHKFERLVAVIQVLNCKGFALSLSLGCHVTYSKIVYIKQNAME